MCFRKESEVSNASTIAQTLDESENNLIYRHLNRLKISIILCTSMKSVRVSDCMTCEGWLHCVSASTNKQAGTKRGTGAHRHHTGTRQSREVNQTECNASLSAFASHGFVLELICPLENWRYHDEDKTLVCFHCFPLNCMCEQVSSSTPRIECAGLE